MRYTTNQLNQLNHWLGFDPLFTEIDDLMSKRVLKTPSWPPYNICKIDENNYSVELAIAGFSETDIEVTVDGDKLFVAGEIKKETTDNYVYHGIAGRSFNRTFTLAEHMVVKTAHMKNGILVINLERVVPEEMKPKKIPIYSTPALESK